MAQSPAGDQSLVMCTGGWYWCQYFKIFITDLDDGTEWTLDKFVGNTKLGEVVGAADWNAAFQRDLNKLEKWASRKLLKFKKGEVQSPTPEQK